jgi:pimeloyl-ACP methyl ester carboxylesterase
MRKLEIRPGVWIAYEDHWFGEPWTVPETVVMVHGNSESSHAWTCWVPHLARKYRVTCGACRLANLTRLDAHSDHADRRPRGRQ